MLALHFHLVWCLLLLLWCCSLHAGASTTFAFRVMSAVVAMILMLLLHWCYSDDIPGAVATSVRLLVLLCWSSGGTFTSATFSKDWASLLMLCWCYFIHTLSYFAVSTNATATFITATWATLLLITGCDNIAIRIFAVLSTYTYCVRNRIRKI